MLQILRNTFGDLGVLWSTFRVLSDYSEYSVIRLGYLRSTPSTLEYFRPEYLRSTPSTLEYFPSTQNSPEYSEYSGTLICTRRITIKSFTSALMKVFPIFIVLTYF